MHIAVDLDDTMNNLLEALVLFHNDTYGTNFKQEDFTSCLYRLTWGGSHEDEVVKLKRFTSSHYFQNVKPASYCQEIIKDLKKQGHELSVITGRIYSLEEQTKVFINKYFKDVFSEIYLTNSYGLTGDKIKKSQMCEKIKADIIIDDDMSHINDCACMGIPVIVFSQPWNRFPIPSNCFRVESWKEIPKLINKLDLELAMEDNRYRYQLA